MARGGDSAAEARVLPCYARLGKGTALRTALGCWGCGVAAAGRRRGACKRADGLVWVGWAGESGMARWENRACRACRAYRFGGVGVLMSGRQVEKSCTCLVGDG